MHKNVFLLVFDGYEAKSLAGVEPLDSSFNHFHLPCSSLDATVDRSAKTRNRTDISDFTTTTTYDMVIKTSMSNKVLFLVKNFFTGHARARFSVPVPPRCGAVRRKPLAGLDLCDTGILHRLPCIGLRFHACQSP
jgi:hypothetical protein